MADFIQTYSNYAKIESVLMYKYAWMCSMQYAFVIAML